MCAIIGIRFINNNKPEVKDFMKIVTQIKLKGTDEFGYILIFRNNRSYENSSYQYRQVSGIKSYQAYKAIIAEDYQKYKYNLVGVLIHSRATPEMESNYVKFPQPYIIDSKYAIAAHGTIPDYYKLIDDYAAELKIAGDKITANKIISKSFEIDVDTESLSIDYKLTQRIISETKGKLTTIAFNLETGEFEHSLMTNRLGLWKFVFNNSMRVYANFNIKNIMILDETNVSGLSKATTQSKQYEYFDPNYRNTQEIFVSFSGGMDIVASVINYLENLYHVLSKSEIISRKIHLTLVYFDWGQNAADKEIATMRNFKKFLIKNYPEIVFHTKLIFLKEVFKLFGDLRLSNKNTEGDILETEQSISYVNFRNSIFLNVLAGYAEKMIISKYGKAIPVDFIFGLNLSEGMIMPDNSYLWLENINKSIRASGDYSQDFAVVAPFVHKTKTDIASYLLRNSVAKEAFDLSFSCYYPDENGKPCGKCGSCILRNKAISRVQQLKKRKPYATKNRKF